MFLKRQIQLCAVRSEHKQTKMYKFIFNFNFLDQFKDTNHQERNKDTDPFKDTVKKNRILGTKDFLQII